MIDCICSTVLSAVQYRRELVARIGTWTELWFVISSCACGEPSIEVVELPPRENAEPQDHDSNERETLSTRTAI